MIIPIVLRPFIVRAATTRVLGSHSLLTSSFYSSAVSGGRRKPRTKSTQISSEPDEEDVPGSEIDETAHNFLPKDMKKSELALTEEEETILEQSESHTIVDPDNSDFTEHSTAYLFNRQQKLQSNFFPTQEVDPKPEKGIDYLEGKEVLVEPEWKDTGLKPELIKILEKFFGKDTKPTIVQAELIPLLLAGERDVIVECQTGSGKSFGYLISLISMIRKHHLFKDKYYKKFKDEPNPVQQLVMVPSEALATQVFDWAVHIYNELDEMARASGKEDAFAIEMGAENLRKQGYFIDPKVLRLRQRVQVLAGKKSQFELDENEMKLLGLKYDIIPKLLIGTPKRLLEAIEKGNLNVRGVETLIIDEVDHLIQRPSAKTYWKKKVNHDSVHPPPAVLFLRAFQEQREGIPNIPVGQPNTGMIGGRGRAVPCQVICTSATVTAANKSYMSRKLRIVDRPIILSIGSNRTTPVQVQHYSADLWTKVSSELIENQGNQQGDEEGEEDYTKIGNEDEIERVAFKYLPSLLLYLMKKFEVKVALLFYSCKRSSVKLREALRDGGVENYFLDERHKLESLLENDDDKYRVLVANEHDSRGIDVSYLSLVCILGRLYNASSFIHAAGRVGRMDKPGVCVSIPMSYMHHRRTNTYYKELEIKPEPLEVPDEITGGNSLTDSFAKNASGEIYFTNEEGEQGEMEDSIARKKNNDDNDDEDEDHDHGIKQAFEDSKVRGEKIKAESAATQRKNVYLRALNPTIKAHIKPEHYDKPSAYFWALEEATREQMKKRNPRENQDEGDDDENQSESSSRNRYEERNKYGRGEARNASRYGNEDGDNFIARNNRNQYERNERRPFNRYNEEEGPSSSRRNRYNNEYDDEDLHVRGRERDERRNAERRNRYNDNNEEDDSSVSTRSHLDRDQRRNPNRYNEEEDLSVSRRNHLERDQRRIRYNDNQGEESSVRGRYTDRDQRRNPNRYNEEEDSSVSRRNHYERDERRNPNRYNEEEEDSSSSRSRRSYSERDENPRRRAHFDRDERESNEYHTRRKNHYSDGPSERGGFFSKRRGQFEERDDQEMQNDSERGNRRNNFQRETNQRRGYSHRE